jgi:hypothetical protein
MTGTVTLVSPNTSGLPVNVGDRVAWTLQYDRSLTPLNIPGGPNIYQHAGMTLSHFVDLTTNTPLPSPSGLSSFSGGTLELNPGNINQGNGTFIASTSWFNPANGLAGFGGLTLTSTSNPLVLPSKLADLQLNTVPFDLRALNYGYQLPPSSAPVLDFWAKADPLSGSGSVSSTTPEPGSLTLLALGAVGLLAGRVRNRRARRTHSCSALSR